VHHRALHRRGDEAAWWAEHQFDPLAVAEKLWRQTRDGGAATTGAGISAQPAARVLSGQPPQAQETGTEPMRAVRVIR
jgi:hypothetical protein